MTDYIHDYRTLGLEPGCTLTALKGARRRLVKSWHPDRFSNGSAMKARAEERIKDINTAFDRLTDYHKNFGVLPSPTAGAGRGPSVIVVDPAPPNPQQRGTPSPNPSEPASAGAGRHRRRWRRRALHWAIALAAAALLAEIVRTGLIETQGPVPSTLRPGASPAEAQTVAPPKPGRPPAKIKHYFTIGSSLGEVLAVQGIPTATEDDVWHYGKSKVYFVNGLVTSWEHDPADPLMATVLSHTPKLNIVSFTLGSTKAEVRAVQGAPLIETDTLWDYGLSKVYFQDNRVSGWDSSPMRPLKARK